MLMLWWMVVLPVSVIRAHLELEVANAGYFSIWIPVIWNIWMIRYLFALSLPWYDENIASVNMLRLRLCRNDAFGKTPILARQLKIVIPPHVDRFSAFSDPREGELLGCYSRLHATMSNKIATVFCYGLFNSGYNMSSLWNHRLSSQEQLEVKEMIKIYRYSTTVKHSKKCIILGMVTPAEILFFALKSELLGRCPVLGSIPDTIRSRSAQIRFCDPHRPIAFHKHRSRAAQHIEKIRNQTVYC